MRRWPLLLLAALAAVAIWGGQKVVGRRIFPPDTTPEGAYDRIALSVGEHRPSELFAYLEREAQWAAFTIRDLRRKACDLVRASYPARQREQLLAAWREEADALDGPEEFALLGMRRGWMARLERDLSGVAQVEIKGDRATVVTGRGTRYPFRLRPNGIWGLTVFTAELQAEAERAARDLEVVERDAADYERAKQERRGSEAEAAESRSRR